MTTLNSIFGEATQTIDNLTIEKTGLTQYGLTVLVENPAQALLVAILLSAKGGLTRENFDTNINQNIYIEDGFSSFITRGTNNIPYRIDQIIINLARTDDQSIDPDNY